MFSFFTQIYAGFAGQSYEYIAEQTRAASLFKALCSAAGTD